MTTRFTPRDIDRRRLLPICLAIGLTWVCAEDTARATVRSTATQPSVAGVMGSAANGGMPATSGSSWWTAFHEPALDTLMQAAAEAPDDGTETRAERSARLGSLFVTARWLTARLTVGQDMLEVLAQRRRWAVVEGPTVQAAEELQAIDKTAAHIEAQSQLIAEQRAEVLAEIRTLSHLAAPILDRLQQDLTDNIRVPQFDAALPLRDRRLTTSTSREAEALGQRAAEVQRLEEASAALNTRFDNARKALEAGHAVARDVLQVYEQLLVQTDRLIRARTALAIAWVQVLAKSE